jgi:ribosomal protein S18 acetylase RimI-like enzyme
MNNTKINNLILQNFKTSRLNTYETLIYKMIDNEVIGFMGLHKYYDNDNNNYISINQLCVDINYRNQGIATELLNSLPDNEKYILFIDKNNDNSHLKLIDFYKKRGFILSSKNNIEIKMKK